jgi:hypothetical protein
VGLREIEEEKSNAMSSNESARNRRKKLPNNFSPTSRVQSSKGFFRLAICPDLLEEGVQDKEPAKKTHPLWTLLFAFAHRARESWWVVRQAAIILLIISQLAS